MKRKERVDDGLRKIQTEGQGVMRVTFVWQEDIPSHLFHSFFCDDAEAAFHLKIAQEGIKGALGTRTFVYSAMTYQSLTRSVWSRVCTRRPTTRHSRWHLCFATNALTVRGLTLCAWLRSIWSVISPALRKLTFIQPLATLRTPPHDAPVHHRRG